ncbi:MAG TPA: hypothetical protein VFQ35_03635 [Polyangiaceae bacterium]|nr:hypothetical protein [Polyangiaceae bacterium]
MLGVRDATVDDSEAFVNYWHYSGDQIKEALRIDLVRLGTPEDTRNRFLRMLRRPGVRSPSVVFSLTLDDEVIGYTNVNMHGPLENYPHFHTYVHTDTRVKKKIAEALAHTPRADTSKTGAGIAAVMIGFGIGSITKHLTHIERLVLQTRVTSVAINRALDLYMPADETRFIENPDGVASAGEFHMRYVPRSRAAVFLERAESLARGG